METQMIYYNLVVGTERAPLYCYLYVSIGSGHGAEQPSPDAQCRRGGRVQQGDREHVRRRLLQSLGRVAMAASWVWTGGRAASFTPALRALGF